jgi:cobalamin biosynthesis Co2+ chelatase CbiK
MAPVLKKAKTGKNAEVRFIVFMFVAGDHAENDIAGDEKDSLFSAVKSAGKKPSVATVKTSTGERAASLGLDADYREILLGHLKKYIQ